MKENLGELQELVLLVIGNLGEEAYGLKIREFIARELSRKITISTVHATLQRLEKKGYVQSRFDKSGSQERGGRPKLIFWVTASGERVLLAQRYQRDRLWKGFPLITTS